METEVVQYLFEEFGIKVINSYILLATGLVIGTLLGFLLRSLI